MAHSLQSLPTALLDNLLNDLPEAVFVFKKQLDAHGNASLMLMACSSLGAKMLEGEPIACPQKPLSHYFPHWVKRGIEELMLEVLAKGKSSTFEDIRYRQNSFEIESASLFKIQALDMDHMVVVMNDLTDLKIAEHQLQQSHTQLSRSIAELEEAQKQLVLSEKMASLGQLISGLAHEINTPISAAQVSGRNLIRLIPELLTLWPELEAELASEYHQLIRSLVKHILEYEGNLTTQEARALRSVVEEQLVNGGLENPGRLARQLIEVHLEERIEDLIPLLKLPQAEKLLRVTSRLGHVKDNLSSIEVATSKAAGVVRALKNYSYVQQDEYLVEGNIRENLENVLVLFNSRLKKGVKVVKEFSELPPVKFYADQLPQVWANLVANALHAMDDQGILTIKTYSDSHHVYVSITDTGHGIPKELQQRIFEPFFTTKPQGQGSGLGLDVVRKILERHHGDIQLDSIPGQTTFTVKLLREFPA